MVDDNQPAVLNPAPDLLVVGELCVDIVVRLEGSSIRFGQHEQTVRDTTITVGSSSAITACGTARLGTATAIASVCGDDEFGTYMLGKLGGRGVNTSPVRIEPGLNTGSSTHLTQPDGDRAILTAMGSIGKTTRYHAPDTLLRAVRHLHVGSYFLQQSLWPDAAALFARARELGLTTSVDGNFDPAQKWDSGIAHVIKQCTVLFGNEQEICGISGHAEPTTGALMLLSTMPDGATVVLKLGADGAIAYHHDAGTITCYRARPPRLTRELVDTIGAGDSLAAGMLHGLISGKDLAEQLRLGLACGTLSTREPGGVRGQPTLEEAERVAAEITVDRRSPSRL